MPTRTYPCFVQTKDRSGHWYWIYYAVNAEQIARSSESYVAKADCEHGIDLMKASTYHLVYTE